MARSRRRFGPLFYVTLAGALLLLLSHPFWKVGSEQFTAWQLSRQLRDPTGSVRREAAARLLQLGPAATSWVIGAMRDGNPQVRLSACSILLGTFPESGGEALAALIAATKDSDPWVRASAVGQFETFTFRYGDCAKEALVALIAATKDSDPSVRASAVEQLVNFIRAYDGSHESRLLEPALRALCESLGDATPHELCNARIAFPGPRPEGAIGCE